MSITPWISTVSQVKNGEDVSAEVVNPILAQHTQREQHLYEKFASIADKSVLIAYDQPVFEQTPVALSKNKVVFYTREVVEDVAQEGLDLAKVEFIVRPTQSAFAAANSSYSIGLVKEMHDNDQLADIYLMGLVELDVNIDDPVDGLLQTSEIDEDGVFEPGPLFLSRTSAGKLTRNPGGVAIYVGYAFNRRNFLLAPNVSELNQFYTTYRYNVLDRPAGRPALSGTWTVNNPDLDRVGWVDIADLSEAYELLAPEGAKFFYNLPAESLILTDSGISEDDQLEQADLAKNLPPNPPNLTMLIVNGVIQEPRDEHNPEGVYSVNELGIWWYNDEDGGQPWSSDIDAKLAVTADAGSNEIYLAGHGFGIDDVVRFTTSAADLPAPLAIDTDYYVVELNEDGDHFKVSLTQGGAVLGIDDAGTGTHWIDQPYLWKFSRGTNEFRPKISIQFIRVNPSIREAIVTSLKPYNADNEALRFYKADKSAIANTGDLLARLLLEFAAGTEVTSSAKAIKSLSYSETTGDITYVETPIISKLTQGTGITISQVTVDSVAQPGSYIISSSTNNASGRVNSIEPDGAELLFNGLHSYINMTVPSFLPSSLIGKITLPTGIPEADMTFVMLMIGTETLATTKTVEFEFTYAVTKDGTLLDTTVSTPVTVSFDMPNPYTAKTCFKVGNTTNAIAAATLKIPATAFTGGDCAVNFKLARKQAASTPLTTPIGIVDIYWKIG